MKKIYEVAKNIEKTIAPYALAAGHTALIAGFAIYSGAPTSNIAVATGAGIAVSSLEGLLLRELLKTN